MFRTIVSLLLFGSLSPVSVPFQVESLPELLHVAPPPLTRALSVSADFSASGAIVIDLLSAKELYARAPDQPRSFASLAKIMTAIVILEQHALEEVVTVPKDAVTISGNAAVLQAGERYTVKDLLGALLVGSANDAAYALALFHSGSIQDFAKEMNVRAKVLGLERTHFTNPMGFDGAGQESTPRDLAWLAMYAWKNELLRSLASRREYILREKTSSRTIVLGNTNQLLSSHPSSFFGLKTGTTELAGECLISLAYTGGRPYIFVVLKSSDRYRDTLHLLRSLSQKHA